MFERFTDEARAIVLDAKRQATSMGHRYVGTEHILLSLVQPERGRSYAVLHGAGLDAERVRADTERLLAESARTLGPEDAAALEAIGIDLDAVRAKVEESFGPGALTPPPPPARGWLFGRRGGEPMDAHRFTARSKKVLELALREAIRLHHNRIGSEHLLLGLLREGEGLGAKVIRQAGLDFDDLRRRAIASLDQAA